LNSVLVFEWFMMMLIAGVAGRSRTFARAGAVAALCAVFWIALCVAVAGGVAGLGGWNAVSLVAGTAAIFAITLWTGGPRRPIADDDPAGTEPAHRADGDTDSRAAWDTRWIRTMLQQFDDWLERYRSDADPWPEFGEFLRGLLYEHCGASRIKPYRILSEDEVLVPLREMHSTDSLDVLPAQGWPIEQLIAGGRSLLRDDADEEGHRVLRETAELGVGSVAWAFPIRQASRTIGVVFVGDIDRSGLPGPGHRDRLSTMELLISQCWSTLLEVCRSRASATTDPVSGLLTRDVTIGAGEHVIRECHHRREPVAVIVIAIEGLRRLDERGEWCQANAVIRQAAAELAVRCRPTDLLGRFDDSRFIMILRRVDAELGKLIADELVARLRTLGVGGLPDDVEIGFRGGVVSSGSDAPTLAELIAVAVEQCHRARRQGEPTCIAVRSGGESDES
jgi:GGDEF domain-containing protein